MKVWIFSFALLISFTAMAQDDLYVVGSAGYSNADFEQISEKGFTGKIGVGYQFHRQWYLEMGYQQLIDQSASALPLEASQIESFDSMLSAGGVYAALLGKARGETGELYYRLGFVWASVESLSVSAQAECETGNSSQVNFTGGGSYYQCAYNDNQIAGVLGLGYDTFLTENLMLRTELEYAHGSEAFSATSFYVGLRYNF